MLNPKYQRYADRLRELIEEGTAIAKLERQSPGGFSYIQGEDRIKVHGWLTKTRNILQTVFGSESPQYHHFQEALPKDGVNHVEHASDVFPIVGVLNGSLDDLDKGFLLGQEFLIAGEVLDSILEQAKEFAQGHNKDLAAILTRIVLEDALKRIARSEGIDQNKKASSVNDELKQKGKYPQTQWRLIQAWLDIGNAAAHGKFDEYKTEDVTNMIDGVERFLATEFRE